MVARKDRLVHLLLQGWQVYDWKLHHGDNVKDDQQDFLANILRGNWFTPNVDPDDICTEFLILNPPGSSVGGDPYLSADNYYTLENAYKEAFG